MPEGSALWTALVEGRMSVVPRGRRYLVIENPTATHRIRALTPREVATAAEAEVLELLERGLSNERIAALRRRSVRTIANQMASLLRKTGATSRRQLATRTC